MSGRRDPLDRIVALPAGVLVTLIRVAEEWVASGESVVSHIEATGRWSCDHDEKVEPGDAIRLERRVSALQMALAEAWGALPPAVIRWLNAPDEPETTTEGGSAAPLTGQAAQDIADLLGGVEGND